MRRSLLIVAVIAAVVLGAFRVGIGAAPVVPTVDQTVPPPDDQALPPPDEQVIDPAALLNATSVVGLLVDSACYRSRGPNAGAAGLHARCAISCVRKGHRVALVTTDGDVYVVTGDLAADNNAKLIPMMNQMVTLTGAVRDDVVYNGVMESKALLDANAVQATDPVDARRPAGIEEGVVEDTHIRKGDFREGDVVNGPVKVIEAFKVELALKLPVL